MRAVPLLALPLVIAGCAAADRYPSLLPRAAEQQSFAEPAPPAPTPMVADPALDAQIAAAQAKLVDGSARFEAAAGKAERLARSAAARTPGSDAWLDAQVALADLDAARSDNLATLTDLEAAASKRAAALEPDYPALQTAIEAGRATLATQSARIATIQALLPPAQ